MGISRSSAERSSCRSRQSTRFRGRPSGASRRYFSWINAPDIKGKGDSRIFFVAKFVTSSLQAKWWRRGELSRYGMLPNRNILICIGAKRANIASPAGLPYRFLTNRPSLSI